jgi:arylsulfatase A-like enzyme
MLHGEGYATGLVGKWHLGSRPGSPNAHGFDQFFGFLDGCVDYYSHRFYWGEPNIVNYHDLWRNSEEVFEDGSYLTEVFTREAKQFIKASQARPFFLYLAYNAPHYPMHAPRRYLERFPGLAPERQVYAAMLAAVDDGVGEIRQLLRQLGIERHTIVFFASDNGATRERRAGLQGRPATAGQNTPCRGYKFSLFDGGLRVPAILSWPGQLPQAQVSGQVGSHIDLMPTILRAVGVAPPTDRKLDGIDLFPALQQGSLVERPPLYWASQGQLAVRRGAWKLVIRGFEADGTPAGSKPLAGDDELFLSNLEEDAGESRNQRYVQRDLCQALEKEARAWWKELESTSESSA